MSLNISSSGSKSRYTRRIQSSNSNKNSNVPIQQKRTTTSTVTGLSGHNKRNLWLDYPSNEEFLPSHNSQGLASMTSFKIKFPQHRELYLKENEIKITNVLKKKHIDFSINYKSGECEIKTTNQTYDPFIIVKGKLLMNCVVRGVPIEKAKQIVLKDNVFCDVIHVKMLCKNKKIFEKRKKRLYGPNGSTLKAIEILTKTYIVIMGGTVTAMGSVEGCKEVRKIVEDCMFNQHPIYIIKQLMIKNKYKNDPNMKDKDWSKFLPTFKTKRNKRRVKVKKKKTIKRKKSYFVPQPQKKKIDLELDDGSYFIKEKERIKIRKERKRKQIKEEAAGNFSKKENKSIDEKIQNIQRVNKKKRKRQNKSVESFIDSRTKSKKRKF